MRASDEMSRSGLSGYLYVIKAVILIETESTSVQCYLVVVHPSRVSEYKFL